MKHNVTVKIVLDTRRAKQAGLYPVKMRVTFQRKQKYYPISVKDNSGAFVLFDLNPDDFDRVFGAKPRGDHKEQREYLDNLKSKANGVVEALPFFTFEQFEAKMFGQNTDISSANLYVSTK